MSGHLPEAISPRLRGEVVEKGITAKDEIKVLVHHEIRHPLPADVDEATDGYGLILELDPELVEHPYRPINGEDDVALLGQG